MDRADLELWKEHVLKSKISDGPKIITENRSDINRIIILGPLLSVMYVRDVQPCNFSNIWDLFSKIETKTMATFHSVALVFPYSATTQIFRH